MNINAIEEFRAALNSGATNSETVLSEDGIERLCRYYELMLVWNERLHLVAPCSPTEFVTRHVLESLQVVPHVDVNARVADVGSGAGLPIIPVLVARPDVRASLIESSQKKTVFLREALRTTRTLAQSQVVNKRFEDLPTPDIDYVTCRALDRFSELLPQLIDWAPKSATLLLFGGETLRKRIEATGLDVAGIKIPESERRWLFVAQRENKPG